MFCNKCGCEIKDTASFCKKCGSPVEEELKKTSELERKLARLFLTKRTELLIGLIAVLVIAGAAVVGVNLWKNQQNQEPEAVVVKVVSVDLKDEYEMEDDKLILDPLTASYDDGSADTITEYKVYIDTLEYTMTDGIIDGKNLYDGQHLMHLEWLRDGVKYTYEKTVGIKHKMDTWGKYPDIVGRTGKEIAAKYGALTAPEFGRLSEGDWGYAYCNLPALNLRLTFPAGLFDNPENYGDSDAGCIEMTGTLSDLFYNMESEMSQARLAEILEVTLSQNEGGGCSGALGSGNRIYIGVGEVTDGIYMPTTTVRVTVNDTRQKEIFEYFF